MFVCKLLALYWVFLVRSSAGSEVQRSRDVTVLVTSVRNQTGHWETQVILCRDNLRKSVTAFSSVEVEPRASSCNDRTPSYDVIITIRTPPTLRVRAGYELIPGLGSYKFHSVAATWPSARVTCEQEGGHLVILNSAEEAEAMVKLFARNPNITGGPAAKDRSWVGAKESETTNGQFYTVFGESLASTGFQRWYPGRPGVGSLGDFLWFWGATGNLGEEAAAAQHKFTFVSEQHIC